MAKVYLRVPSYEAETDDQGESNRPQSRNYVTVGLQCLALFCAAIIGFVIRDVSCSRCKLQILDGQFVPQGITESSYKEVAIS